MTLDAELMLIEALFYGAYLNTADEIGMAAEAQVDLGLGPRKSLALYRSWSPRKDPDVSRDVRMMVPVFYDLERHQLKVWAVLGVTTKPLIVRYARSPTVIAAHDAEGKRLDLAGVNFKFKSTKFMVAYPVMAELYVSRLLDRAEFRKLCDRHKTQDEILKHLK